jgi:hypothetical protein
MAKSALRISGHCADTQVECLPNARSNQGALVEGFRDTCCTPVAKGRYECVLIVAAAFTVAIIYEMRNVSG